MQQQPLKEVTFTRIINAPRQLGFKVWTDEKHLAEWWGPKGFTNPVCEVDARTGGSILIHMAWWGDGPVFPMKGVFYEVDEPSKLVFSALAFEGEDGSFGIENMNTVTFEDLAITEQSLPIHVAVIRAGKAVEGALAGMEQGWNESLDKLTVFITTIN